MSSYDGRPSRSSSLFGIIPIVINENIERHGLLLGAINSIVPFYEITAGYHTLRKIFTTWRAGDTMRPDALEIRNVGLFVVATGYILVGGVVGVMEFKRGLAGAKK